MAGRPRSSGGSSSRLYLISERLCLSPDACSAFFFLGERRQRQRHLGNRRACLGYGSEQGSTFKKTWCRTHLIGGVRDKYATRSRRCRFTRLRLPDVGAGKAQRSHYAVDSRCASGDRASGCNSSRRC